MELDTAVDMLAQRLTNVPPDLLMLHKQQVNRAFQGKYF
jgi:hypothetical protein